MSPTEFPTLPAPGDELLEALAEACGTVQARATDRLASAHDASHYLLTPRAVVVPSSVEEVASVFAATRRLGVPVTFRSGGTSLSGQAGSDGVLIDTRRRFRDIDVMDDGARVRTGPGATIRAVNNRLMRHGCKLGPDPASEIACTVGGVVANNSSGMACGTHANTYRTLDSAVLVLPSGTIVDTSLPDADEVLRVAEPTLHAGLARLRDRVRADPDSLATIAALYAIKNTMGYGINSFVDFDRPVDILEHLVIGSEGTLAFVAEATFRTVPVRAHLATGLLVFPDLAAATSSLPALVAAGFATIELLDATSLRVAQRDPEATPELLALDVVDHAALLVEYQEESAADLALRLSQAPDLFRSLTLARPATLGADPKARAQLWHVRKGLYTLVAGARPSGTTALLEDIAVPVDRLYTTCIELTRLFAKYRYEEPVIFGHAKDGNIHFLLNERFDDPASLERYEAFTEEMVELVLSQGGTLKAEHGTGRIMAPFVRRQYGDELYDVMREVKELFDPEGLLNPGVLLTDDADAHLRNLKLAPTVEAEVDRCVECGYCEPVCPSKDLTLTPRERIVLRREMQRAEHAGDGALLARLREEYGYDGVDTCAVDGMCQTACPVLINTGDLVRRLRAENVGGVVSAVWNTAGTAWSTTTRIASTALTIASAVPAPLIDLPNRAVRAVLGRDTVPLWSTDLPRGGARRTPGATAGASGGAAAAVFFQACVGTMFAPADGSHGVAAALESLAAKAGIGLLRPDEIDGLCCGTPWKSKGILGGYSDMVTRTMNALWQSSQQGRLPIVCDNSSCTEGLILALEKAMDAHPDYRAMRFVDAVDFAAERILPALEVTAPLDSIVVHPTCSSTRAGSNMHLLELAHAVAATVTVPDDWGCCAFAGDRGMLHPELTRSATQRESTEVKSGTFDAYVSCNRTCEIGMTRATGHPYQHVLEVLDRATGGRA